MRDYDPTTGRYIQADPLGLVDGSSVYGYALQSPGRYVDPRGEQSVPGSRIPLPAPSGRAPTSKDYKNAWREVLEWSRKYNPIDLLLQEIVEMCISDEASRCELVRQRCHDSCVNYFVEGPFEGRDQFSGYRKCMRECMKAHDCQY